MAGAAVSRQAHHHRQVVPPWLLRPTRPIRPRKGCIVCAVLLALPACGKSGSEATTINAASASRTPTAVAAVLTPSPHGSPVAGDEMIQSDDCWGFDSGKLQKLSSLGLKLTFAREVNKADVDPGMSSAKTGTQQFEVGRVCSFTSTAEGKKTFATFMISGVRFEDEKSARTEYDSNAHERRWATAVLVGEQGVHAADPSDGPNDPESCQAVKQVENKVVRLSQVGTDVCSSEALFNLTDEVLHLEGF